MTYRFIRHVIFAVILGAAATALSNCADTTQESCSEFPFGNAPPQNVREFYFAYRGVERSIDRLSAAAVSNAPLSLAEITTLCRAATSLVAFTGKLPGPARSAYVAAAQSLRDVSYELAEVARGTSAVSARDATQRARSALTALAEDVPPLWLSVASTLHGRMQPGGQM